MIKQILVEKRNDPKLSLFLTLRYLGKPCSYIDIAEQFGASVITAHQHIHGIVDILGKMAPDIIKWPPIEEVSQVEADFKS